MRIRGGGWSSAQGFGAVGRAHGRGGSRGRFLVLGTEGGRLPASGPTAGRGRRTRQGRHNRSIGQGRKAKRRRRTAPRQADAFWYPRSRTTSRTSLQVGNSRPLRRLYSWMAPRNSTPPRSSRARRWPGPRTADARWRATRRPPSGPCGDGRRLVAGQGDLVADDFDVVAGRMLDHGRTSGRGVSRPTPHRRGVATAALFHDHRARSLAVSA